MSTVGVLRRVIRGFTLPGVARLAGSVPGSFLTSVSFEIPLVGCVTWGAGKSFTTLSLGHQIILADITAEQQHLNLAKYLIGS